MYAKTVVTPDGCWVWTSRKDREGYPILRYLVSGKSKDLSAHRWSLQQKLGRPIGYGLYALHTCDVRLCINPDHLYEGDHRQNMRDMVARNRQPKKRLLWSQERLPFEEQEPLF